MKKNKLLFIVLAFLGLVNMRLQACDICGCGAGSYYIGILPEFNSKIVGLRYRSSNLLTHLGPSGNRTYLTTDEQYQTTEVWAGWTIKEKFRLMAFLPVGYNSKSNETSGLISKSGLSDASLQGFYRLIRKSKTIEGEKSNKLLIRDLWVGGGVKLPTGKYNPADKSNTSSTTNLFQLGTGSLDFIMSAMYDIRLQDLGLNINSSYKINTTNQYDYYYGNRFSSTAQLYYKFRIKNKFMIAPNAGISYENSAKDFDGGYSNRNTGGTALFSSLGAELTYKKIALGGNWQPVINQNLGEGAVETGNRAMLHLSIVF